MTAATLDKNRSRLLGGLTIAAANHLATDTMMVEDNNSVRWLRTVRVDDVLLVDFPADDTGPRSINCYFVEVQDFADLPNGKKFKIDPRCLFYSLQWKHNGIPPDFHLALVKNPQLWFDFVTTMLFDALNRHDPHLFDTLRAAASAD
jgi:hypothetical protein